MLTNRGILLVFVDNPKLSDIYTALKRSWLVVFFIYKEVFPMKKNKDRRIFSNTAARTKSANIAGRFTPRGGPRR